MRLRVSVVMLKLAIIADLLAESLSGFLRWLRMNGDQQLRIPSRAFPMYQVSGWRLISPSRHPPTYAIVYVVPTRSHVIS